MGERGAALLLERLACRRNAPLVVIASSGLLTFSPGQTSQTVAVDVRCDTAQEPNENFQVNLSEPTGATIFTGRGVGTIRNDD